MERLSGRFYSGFVLVEAIIALGLFSLISASVWVLAFQADNINTLNNLRFATISFSGDILENQFFTSLAPDWQAFSGDGVNKEIENNGFIFENKLYAIAPCLIEINEDLNKKQLRESVVVLDTEEAKNIGHDCGGFPDFKKINGVSVLSGATSIGSARATGIDFFGDKFFISFFDNNESSPDLAVGSVNAPLEFSVDVGPGLNSIDVTDGIVYGVQKSTTTQIAIFNSSNLSLIATSTLPSVAGVRPEGWSIFYYDKRLYVGTKRTAGREFHVFNVENPSNPRWLGSLEINHNINNIVVRDNLAFLATSGNEKDLIILDVTDPQNMAQILRFDLPGNEDSRFLKLLGDRLYVGRLKSTVGNPEFYILDVGMLYEGVNEVSIIGAFAVHADVNAIAVQHDYAILGTSKTGANLQVLNIASTTKIISVATLATSQKITGIDYQGNSLAVSIFGDQNILSLDLFE